MDSSPAQPDPCQPGISQPGTIQPGTIQPGVSPEALQPSLAARVDGTAAPVLLIGPGDNQGDAQALRALGLAVWIDPYLQVGPPSDTRGAWELLAGLAAPDPGWLVMTSARAYPSWADLVGRERLLVQMRAAAARGLRAAAVGAATARSLPDLSWPAPLIARDSSGAGLARELAALGPSRAIVAQSEIAGSDLERGLLERGWEVLAKPVYTTTTVSVRPSSAQAVAAGNVSAVVLRSPSAVVGLLAHARPDPGIVLVAGGRTTAAAAKAHGLTVWTSAGPRPDEVAATVLRVLGGKRT